MKRNREMRKTAFTLLLTLCLSAGIFPLFSCDSESGGINTKPNIALDYVTQWSYAFPEDLAETGFDYDPDGGLWDALATKTTTINGTGYLVLSFDPTSSKQNSRIFIFDVSVPMVPSLISSIAVLVQETVSHHIRSMDVRDGILYAGMFGDRGLWMVDLTNPANPVDLGIADVKTNDCVTAFGDHYILSSGQHYDGITICDVADPENVHEVARIDLPSRDVYLDIDGHLIVTGIGKTLTIFDVSDPSDPKQMSQIDLEISGDLTTEPQPPEEGEAHWKNLVNIIDIQASGNYVYATFGAGQVRVIDISDPASPKEIGEVPTGGFAIKASLNGDTLYVTKSDPEQSVLELVVADVSEPLKPVILDTAETESMFAFGGAYLMYMFTRPQVIGEFVYVPGINYFDIFKLNEK